MTCKGKLYISAVSASPKIFWVPSMNATFGQTMICVLTELSDCFFYVKNHGKMLLTYSQAWWHQTESQTFWHKLLFIAIIEIYIASWIRNVRYQRNSLRELWWKMYHVQCMWASVTPILLQPWLQRGDVKSLRNGDLHISQLDIVSWTQAVVVIHIIFFVLCD